MARDISIAISAKDNFTQAITTMKNANQSFNKDLTGLQQKLDALNKNKITLKVETDRARVALRDAEKQFKATGDAADKMNMEMANADYEQARRNLSLVSKEARQAEKDILKLTSTVSKAENRASGGGTKGLLSGLGSAGMTKMIGDAASVLANTAVSSAYGSDAGTMFGSVLSGAGSGAAIGSMVGGPGIGTAVGAVIGAGLGAATGGASIYGKKDDAFKGTVQELYDSEKARQARDLASGIGIAGTREQQLISFSTLLGSDEAARDYLAQMIEFAEKTPFGYDQLADVSKTLLAYGYKADELIPLLTQVGDAGSALSMSAEDINNVAVYLGRMKITGQTTMRYLNPLLEKGIPVWDYLAKASGKTKEEVQEMVSKGLVPGAEAAQAIADYMGADFAGNMDRQSRTYEGLVSNLEDLQEALDAAMGEGYSNERKKGIQAQIDFFEGPEGEKMKEANRMIGEWQASLDNAREQAIRDSIKKTMDSEEYLRAAAEGNRVEMGRLIAEAQIKGENEYKASEGYKLQLQADLDLAKSIRENTSLQQEYWNTGYVMGKQFSKGRMAAQQQGVTPTYVGPGTYLGDFGGKYAYGINYVPYDNFPALLHQGEKVVTASEARSSSKTAEVVVTGNNFVIREEADVERVAKEICNQMKIAAMLVG